MQILAGNAIVNCALTGAPLTPGSTVLVFLHGWGRTMEDFDALRETLMNRLPAATFLQFDAPGFGRSPLPEGKSFSLTDYAMALGGLLEKLAVTRPVLVGHSFGAGIALTYAARFPASVEKIVLISAAGIRRRSFQHWLLTAGRFLFRGIVFGFRDFRFTLRLKNLLGMFFGSRDYRHARGALRDTFKKVVAEDLRPIAGRIERPTLLIWGSRDAETPLRDGRTYHELIKGSRLEILDAGHFPILEKPAECAQLIASFLEHA
ncbi:alpha/beta hydrolase [Candidatus Parcubacteria bacterium]|nr:alpha/beta hydrolase [Candidatus Parcubacteria bacterium]